MRAMILTILITFALGGCATQGISGFDYTPTKQSAVINEKTVARPQSAVWDELVKELAKSFFVINNIERESRIINVSFNSNSPSDYVDCGRTKRTYTQGDKTETFDYAVADRSTYKFAGQSQPNPYAVSYAIVNREPTLEGRSNIYVAPDTTNPNRTVVSVNTRYIISFRVGGEGVVQHSNGTVLSRSPIPEKSSSIIFNTNKPSTTNAKGDPVVCAGLGRLETNILDMVR